MQLSELVAFLDDFMHKSDFTDALPIGQLVEGRPEVRKVATAVTANAETMERAAEWGADLLLVHHGMFWDNADRVVRGHLKRRLKCLLDRDMSLVGYHLPLDAHEEVGNNILFARAMGLRDVEPFGLYHGKKIGWKGRLEPALGPGEFVARARAYYGREPMAAFLAGPEKIATVAVVSGGAWDHVAEAAREGCDCYVTGNADEPSPSLAREEAIHFLAFGHYATERVGIRRLGEVVAERFGLDVRFVEVENRL